jgi:pimeloyl-ACP methyl ester carboxylesterase
MSLTLKIARTYFKIGSAVAPKSTAKRGFKTFQKVRIKSIRNRENEFFETAKKFSVPGKYETIDCFELGNPSGDLVLLVHGWESNAGSMSKFAFRFAEMGYRVVAFNLPGHAQYETSSTNLLECFTSMNEVLDHLNPTNPISVVSHSFGSAVTANALSRSKYEVDRLVILTTPNKIEDIFLEFKRIVALGDKAYASMLNITQQLLGEPLSNLDVVYNLNKIQYKELLLIHDENDRILPYSNSKTIHENTRDSSIVTLEKVGHYKMLWFDEVIEQAVSFVAKEEEVVG